MKIRVGTRGSPLARTQATRVQEALAELDPSPETELVVVKTQGDRDDFSPLDRPVSAGVFTSALTDALLAGEIDLAVHSLKDLPLADPAGTRIAAMLERDDPADVLLIREAWDPDHVLGLKPGSRVGSSAPRRQNQLFETEEDLVPVDVRGNVGRRLSLVETGVLDALVMAAAVEKRMNLRLPEGVRRRRLDPVRFPPAPGQAAIAVQACTDTEAARLAARIDHAGTRTAVETEREVLGQLGGGCGLPLGVYADQDPQGQWHVHATYGIREGLGIVRAESSGPDPRVLAQHVAVFLSKARDRERDEQSRGDRRGPKKEVAPNAPVLVVTLDTGQAARYATRLSSLGWRVVAWPLIETVPVQTDPPVCEEPFWIAVTSARAAASAAALACRPDGSWRRVRVAANGPATASALREHGLPVHEVARDGSGSGLAREIVSFPGESLPVVWPAAKRPAGGLREGLEQAGFRVVHWPVYEVVPRRPVPSFPVSSQADALLVTSPSNGRVLAEAGVSRDVARHWFAIGGTTADALRESGLALSGVAASASPRGVADLLQGLGMNERPLRAVRRDSG